VGAALGEILGAGCRLQQQHTSAVWLNIDQWGFDISLDLLPLGWGQVVVDGSWQLIQSNRWDLEKLTNGVEFSSRKGCRHGGLAIAALPLALYFHDDVTQLQTQIQQAIAVWMGDAIVDPELLFSVLIVGYGIALALREELDPSRLIVDLIADLEIPALAPVVSQMLHQVQTLAKQQTSLAIATAQLAKTYLPHQPALFELSIVLHSVLTVPEDFRLLLVQVAQASRQPQIACAIAGAIAGASNSLAGLPIGWRRKLTSDPEGASPLAHLWGVASEAELTVLAERLLASWSGAYNPAQGSVDGSVLLTVAAPNVIRPLPSR
jgi:ADP-ribosylglycohydrolase